MISFVVPPLAGKSQDDHLQETLNSDLRIFSEPKISPTSGVSVQFCSGALLQQHQLGIKPEMEIKQPGPENPTTHTRNSLELQVLLSGASTRKLRQEQAHGTALAGITETQHQRFRSEHSRGKGEENNANNLKFNRGGNVRHLHILGFLGVRVLLAATTCAWSAVASRWAGSAAA